MRLTIKRLRPVDIGAVFKMASDFAQEKVVEYPKVDLDKVALSVLSSLEEESSLYFIAYDGKRPAGYIIANIQSREAATPAEVCFFHEIYVVPSKRGSAIAFRLGQAVFKASLALGVENFEALSLAGNDRWEKFGFLPYATIGHLDVGKAKQYVNRE